MNILLNRGIYPEFLGEKATAENVVGAIDEIILPANRSRMCAELAAADDMWVRPDGVASKLIANDVLRHVMR